MIFNELLFICQAHKYNYFIINNLINFHLIGMQKLWFDVYYFILKLSGTRKRWPYTAVK